METFQVDILLNRMNDRILYSCVMASLLVHVVTIPAASLMIRAMPATPVHVPIDLVNVPRVEEAKTLEASPPPPASKSKAAKITAPKLLSQPETIETPALAPKGNPKEEIKEPEKLIEPLPRLASLPPEPASVKGGWNVGERPGEAEGGAAGAGNLFGKGEVGVVDGSGLSGGGGGKGTAGLGRGTKGDGTGGGGVGSGDALSGLARPVGGYQVKPLYPESAGKQGLRELRSSNCAFWRTAKWEKSRSNNPRGIPISTWQPPTRSEDGSLNQHEWANNLLPSGSYYR